MLCISFQQPNGGGNCQKDEEDTDRDRGRKRELPFP